MKLVALSCNACGGKLKASTTTRFLTCSFCGAELAVHFEDGATFTEVREAVRELTKATDELRDEVASLKRDRDRADAELELVRIDREWDAEREALMSKDRTGRRYVPTHAQGWMGIGAGVVCAIFACVFGAVSPKSTSIGAFGVVLGLIAAALGVAVGVATMRRANQYVAARRLYDDRRAQAEKRLSTSTERARS